MTDMQKFREDMDAIRAREVASRDARYKTRREGPAWNKTGRPKHPASRYLLEMYGITWEQKLAMFHAQDGRCGNPGCARKIDEATKAHVDHDHVTGQVRGLLCRKCNLALGHADDSPRKLRGLAEYLQNHERKHAALDARVA